MKNKLNNISNIDTIKNNINKNKWIKFLFKSILGDTNIDSTLKELMQFKKDNIENINWIDFINLKDPQSDTFDFEKDLTFFNAIPKYLWLRILEDPDFDFSEEEFEDIFKSFFVKMDIEWKEILWSYKSLISDNFKEFRENYFRFWHNQDYFSNIILILLNSTSHKKTQDLEIMQSREIQTDFVEKELKDIWEDDIKYFDLLNKKEKEDDFNLIYSPHIEYSRGNLFADIYGKEFDIDLKDIKNNSKDYQLFKDTLTIRWIIWESLFWENDLFTQFFSKSFKLNNWSNEFFLEFSASFDFKKWFKISPLIEQAIETEESEFELWEIKNNNLVKLFNLLYNNENESISLLKKDLLIKKDKIVDLIWNDWYNNFLIGINDLVNIEKDLEKMIFVMDNQ